jgi:histidinol-phosphatase (PHP family)
MCVHAIEIGITEIAFTEHLDFTPTDIAYDAFHYDKWMVDLSAARDEFAGRLIIRTGVEVDYQDRHRSQIEDFLGSHAFDYVLGSVHYVNGIIMQDQERYFTGKSIRDTYIPYFDAALAAVETGLFDALAHPDLCKRYGVIHYGKFKLNEFYPDVKVVLTAIIEKGMALEVNTSGLRQAPSETYPGIDTLRLYKELGGTAVTIGSDSHDVSQLGFGLSDAVSMLVEVGLPLPVRFINRSAC